MLLSDTTRLLLGRTLLALLVEALLLGLLLGGGDGGEALLLLDAPLLLVLELRSRDIECET